MKSAVRFAVGAFALSALATEGLLRWRRAIPDVVPRAASAGTVPSSNAHIIADSLVVAEQSIVENDPFRLSNEPPAVRYDPRREQTASVNSVGPPPSLRPSLTLKAIVGGPPWSAVVDGIPGQPPGTMVRAGSTFDKLVARVVTRDSVVVQGPDTTWVLTFRPHP